MSNSTLNLKFRAQDRPTESVMNTNRRHIHLPHLPSSRLQFSSSLEQINPNMLHPHSNDHSFLFTSVPEQSIDDAAYHTWQPINYSSRAAKTAQNYRTYKSMGPLRLNPSAEEDSDSPSGVYSPPLWKSTENEVSKNNYQNLSPASRTQVIARGQGELMEMVRNMPESCYELSLKDLVERGPTMADVAEEDFSTEILVKSEDGKVNKKKKKKVMRRSGRIDSGGGFLLKMVFPISLGSNQKSKVVIRNKTMKKNKSDLCAEETNERVSGRPCVDKDWWKKWVSASRGSAGSESGVSSLNSASIKSSSSTGSSSSSCSSRCSTRRNTGGCWSFILLKKKRKA